ncbi:hypothetical protein [Actinophytocola oryzae]|uniref:Cupin domain-containing protein n=1 Tax=Actinophytocola oryzae TaxID=502181 RepID=A0A4R7W1S6_9PSEU|nr:hypothetical protein [Actinophytocola oryzae]TDV56434.1 hypothetical protein CLV71_102501 [Actinophytocola oryzae]
MKLHEDFADLVVNPGEAHFTDHQSLFNMVNLIEFGGAADRPTHVPADLGGTGQIVFWESTGAADQLPFWNTNFDGDCYLYIVHGSVRVEFKETEGDKRFGHYVARTGDLFCLPRDIAHRTFSGDGKRRITLEIMPRNRFWAGIGQNPVEPDQSATVGGFGFAFDGDDAVVTWPDGTLRTPKEFFVRGVRAMVAYEMHMGLNEFDNGFVVHDLGDRVDLKAPGYAETLPGRQVLAVFKGLLQNA